MANKKQNIKQGKKNNPYQKVAASTAVKRSPLLQISIIWPMLVIAAVKGGEDVLQLYPPQTVYGQVVPQVAGIVPVDEAVLQRWQVKHKGEQRDRPCKQVFAAGTSLLPLVQGFSRFRVFLHGGCRFPRQCYRFFRYPRSTEPWITCTGFLYRLSIRGRWPVCTKYLVQSRKVPVNSLFLFVAMISMI